MYLSHVLLVLSSLLFLSAAQGALVCPVEQLTDKRVAHLKKCLNSRLANCEVVSTNPKQRQKCKALFRAKFDRESGTNCTDDVLAKIGRLVEFMTRERSNYAGTTAARNRFLDHATSPDTSIEMEPCKPNTANHVQCRNESNPFSGPDRSTTRNQAQNDCKVIPGGNQCTCADPDCMCFTACRNKRRGCVTRKNKDGIFTTVCACEQNPNRMNHQGCMLA